MRVNYPIIIAEVGVNHNGNKNLLFKIIDEISKSKINFIKFQLYKTDNLVLKHSPKTNYQKKILLSQYQMLKKYELTIVQCREIINYCKKKKIKPLFSIFDNQSLKDFKSLNQKTIKIPSGEIDNYPLIKNIGKLDINIILSTGMSSIKEIEECIQILVKYGTKKNKISILYCHSEYPTMLKDLDLTKIQKYKKKFNLKIGFSDHTRGYLASSAAVALGAEIIEKHVTLKTSLKGPDHSSSLEISKLPEFIENLKNISNACTPKVKLSISENNNKPIIRKSIYSKTTIKKGEKFSEDNLITLRPAKGLSPMKWTNLLNKKAKKNYKKFSLIQI